MCLVSFNFIIVISLLSFFFKTLLNLKFFFNVLNFTKLLGCLFIYLYIYLLNNVFYVILTFSVFYFQVYYVLFVSVPANTNFRNFILHYSLYMLLLLGLFYKYSVLNDHLYTNFTELTNNTLLLSLNNRDVEALLNFITDTTSFEGKSFNLIMYTNYIYQVYFLNTSS